MANVDEVRVCRSCGHIDAADQTGRCPTCGLFFEFAIMARAEAEQLGRQRRRRIWRRRLGLSLVLVVLVGGMTMWALGVWFDLGLPPPGATTRLDTPVGPQIWAQWRRTVHNTGHTPEAPPWPHRVAWTYSTPQALQAPPAVLGPRVYVATMDGQLLALDQHTGRLVWSYTSGQPAGATPAIAGDMVIGVVRPGRIFALNRHTGEVQWDSDLQHPILTSPLVVQGSVYIGAGDQYLYALDVATGRQRWAFDTGGWVASPVVSAGNRVLVTAQHSRLHGVSAATGRQRFVYDTGLGRALVGGVAVDGTRAYFGSLGGYVWAVDWRPTTSPWDRALLFWQSNLYIWGMRAKPPVQKGMVWVRRLRGDIVHTPAIAHQSLYVTTARGRVAAFDLARGQQRWSVDLGVDITASPTVAGDTVLLGTATGLVQGLEARTGAAVWSFQADGTITGSPIVAGQTMYVVSRRGTLYAVTASP